MLTKKFQVLAQVVGCVTIGLLAVYGLVTLLGGGPALASALDTIRAAGAAPVIPATFNYQGLLRNPDGSLTTGSYTITARIYDAAASGSALYTETFPNVTVRDGLFNIVLGDNPQGQDLQAGFSATPRYIGITLVGQGDELIPRQRLHAVPWAMYATNASQAVDFNVTGLFTATSIHASGDAAVNGGLSVTGTVTVDGAAPIRIIRYENRGNDADFDTGIPFSDWYCVNAGWSTRFDIQESGTYNNMIWTYVHPISNTWQVNATFASHNDDEDPDFDIVCFRRNIASWEGASWELNHPD